MILRYRWLVAVFVGALLSSTAFGLVQTATEAPASARLLLVLPFENRTGHANLDWIGEGAADIFNRRLDSAGFLTIGRDDRLYALDRLGLPLSFEPSRATTIRIAQLLDADSVIVGTYSEAGDQLTATAQILDMRQLTLSPPIQRTAALSKLLDTLNGLCSDLVKKLNPSYAVAEQTFLTADALLQPDAFENYIRGMIAEAPSDRIAPLREAVKLSPSFVPARLELGNAYFANQNYEEAATTFGQMPTDDPNALKADFDRGLALFYTGSDLKAEDAFAFVATQLPLPEVVNNEGVAASRRNRDGLALFQQAVNADPRDPDYHFNLAIALRKKNDIAGASREIDAELKLRPDDTEAQSFAASLKNPSSAAANPDDASPLERIKRGYNETEFRQAAFAMEQMQAMRLAALPAKERAEKLVDAGNQFLGRGLMLEAEREYQDALEADHSSALAHAGLAQVREHSEDFKTARAEAQQSLDLAPNVPAYLVLARMDLQSNQLSAAATEVSAALRIEPQNVNARGMKQAVEAKGQQVVP